MWRQGNLKRDRLVEEARAGKRASMQGLTTEKEEDGVRGLQWKRQKN
jgi:hypothetical protein